MHLELCAIIQLRSQPRQGSSQLLGAVAAQAGHALHKLLPTELTHCGRVKVPTDNQHYNVTRIHLQIRTKITPWKSLVRGNQRVVTQS